MIQISSETARGLLLRAVGLDRRRASPGLPGALEVLDALGCVQLDPLDRVGTNADLVLHARVDGLVRGDWSRTMPGGAFEHFAKERCLLPARLFPHYRVHVPETPWWQGTTRLSRLPAGVLDDVLAEIAARGPIAAEDLSDRGKVEPLDWSGWKGTAKASTMAVEVLWTRCQVVTAGRTAAGTRVYDVPARALPGWHDAPVADAQRALVLQRVRSAGLLSTATGPHWSMLSELRQSDLVRGLVRSGELIEVQVAGARRTYLTSPALLEAPDEGLDDAMRVLGPLDPLLWDRKLVSQIFGFDYIWEVYKPAEQRVWGYYVTPLLYQGQLVGRMEARRVKAEGGAQIAVEKRWGAWPQAPFDEAIDRLRAMQGAG